jgi:alpha-galactosidase
MTDISPEHTRMLKAYLEFWNAHHDAIMLGTVKPLLPNMLYPMVVSDATDKRVVAYYTNMSYSATDQLPGETVLVNGTYSQTLLLDAAADQGEFELIVTDCLGNIVCQRSISLVEGIHKIPVPPAGHAVLKRG